MNNCLANSSIGFYQISKLGCIPITLLLETLLGRSRQQLTGNLLFSLLLITIGMILVVRQEIVYSEVGLMWAVAGIITTSAAQIYFAPLKKELELDSLQLLFHTAPWLTFGSFAMIPLFENVDEILNYGLDVELLTAVGMSCLAAVVFNISNYSVLTAISPLSYTILGHVKTLIIVLIGSYLFRQWPTGHMALGMIIAVLGVAFYTAECEAQALNKTTAGTALPIVVANKV